MGYDLLIKNGEVVDPGGNSGRFDVAINGDRIAAVETGIPAGAAKRVIDATGQYVTPGLIDLHTHVYHGVTYWGVRADPVAAGSGVTTWFDAGSAGGYNFPGFREFVIERSAARIYAFLNISSIGLTAETGELGNPEYWDVDLCCKLIESNRDILRGIKVRIDRKTTRGTGVGGLEAARKAADSCAVPLMVHIGKGPPHIADVLKFMNPGDILTHCFTGGSMRIVDEAGRLRDDVRRIRDSGVIFDLGHGAGSFSFETAESLMADGHMPDVISSDMHQLSIQGPMFDLPTCLSKCMMLGMSFAEAIHAATARPASVMGLPGGSGTLAPGTKADVALFDLEQGDFVFYDVDMNARAGKQFLRNTLTVIDGSPLPSMEQDLPAPWFEQTDHRIRTIHNGKSSSAATGK